LTFAVTFNRVRSMWARFVALLVSVGVAAALVVVGCRGQASEKEAMLAVAASLRNVMPALIDAYRAKHPGAKISATYGASGDLQKQVEGGAPIDGVVFASAMPVDTLIEKGRVEPATRKVLATNTLVLIGPKGAKPVTFQTIDTIPTTEKIAVGDPGAVPAGQYAKAALEKLGKWHAIQGRVVFGGDVAAVLAYTRRGEVAAAFVYKTELRGIDDVTLLDEAQGDWAPRAEVVVGSIKEAKASAEAAAFLDFAASPEGQKILGDFGFGPP
jgi:molybdate transport system substrate-binding protein